MSHLQLADNGNRQPSNNDILEYMLQIPNDQGGYTWVREDQLDDVTDEAFDMVLRMQPHLSDGHLAKGGRERRRARRAARKREKFEARQSKQEFRRERKGGTFLERITGAAGEIVGRFKGEPGGYPDQTKGGMFPQVTGGLNIGVAKWWQNPLVIGGLVIGGGLVIYAITKKKK